MKKRLVVLSGAGISADSGIQTFRGAGGLWENYDVTEIASPEGWLANPELVLDFYNQRRRQLLTVKPNAAHERIAALEAHYDVSVVTQNVDDLHERAGSTRVTHLHGELLKVCSERNRELSYDWKYDLKLGHTADDGAQLRPDIVWFGEEVPMMDVAIDTVSQADVVIIIGTSLQVYPAAGLFRYAPSNAAIYYIDPKTHLANLPSDVHCIAETAVNGMKKLYPKLVALA
ncbi:MAG: NAD-dependent deacylase [Gammaproteobacteria bacterium]|nr:MAG: NAD-dependent deacylase [Gammaproteobacteria bacterium]